jgi:SAM-dependent methyltransferase
MQRLAEAFQHGRRVLELLAPMLAAAKACGRPAPYRVVDTGCGTGYAIRWLAACGALGPDVRLVGVDFNRALIDEARRLAALEGLDCRFESANAFAPDQPATLFLSTGVVHHFRALLPGPAVAAAAVLIAGMMIPFRLWLNLMLDTFGDRLLRE